MIKFIINVRYFIWKERVNMATNSSVSVKKLIEKMNLKNLTPELDVEALKIKQPDINRTALQLAGYYEHF